MPKVKEEAPTIKQITKNSNDVVKKMKLTNTSIPSVSVIGCGGCGVNLTQKFVKQYGPLEHINYYLIDTSYSNFDEELNIPLLIVKGTNGSGKYRAENFDKIKEFLGTKLVEQNILSDINIIIFSASGGSGSVIGPVLLREIVRQKKLCIVITLADMLSQTDIVNSLNTLKTIDNITKQLNMYLPLTLFSNEKGRMTADKGILVHLKRLCHIFTSQCKEIDVTDKLNFLRPNKLFPSDTKIGIHGLYTTYNDQEIESLEEIGFVIFPHEYFDSVITISKDDTLYGATKNPIVIFQGFGDSSLETESCINAFLVPTGTSQEFINKLNDMFHRFDSLTSNITEEIEIESESKAIKTDDGFVL